MSEIRTFATVSVFSVVLLQTLVFPLCLMEMGLPYVEKKDNNVHHASMSYRI